MYFREVNRLILNNWIPDSKSVMMIIPLNSGPNPPRRTSYATCEVSHLLIVKGILSVTELSFISVMFIEWEKSE